MRTRKLSSPAANESFSQLARTVSDYARLCNECRPAGLRTRPRLILRRREARLDPTLPTAVHRFHVGVAHFLQVLRRQRRAKPAAAIQNDLCVRVWSALLDIALDDALAEVHGAG